VIVSDHTLISRDVQDMHNNAIAAYSLSSKIKHNERITIVMLFYYYGIPVFYSSL